MVKKKFSISISSILRRLWSNPKVQKIVWSLVVRAAEWGIEKAIKWIDKKKSDKEKENIKSDRSSKISKSD